MLPNFITIGHITKDLLPNGDFTPGGTVTFAALTARNLGLQTAIITAAPAELQALPLYENIIISGQKSQVATIFENVYQANKRIQYVRAVAPIIEAKDVPSEWAASAQIVLIGPVAQECDVSLLEVFKNALIGITPQGFMRGWDEHGQVYPLEWQEADYFLPRISTLILSEEDLPTGQAGQVILENYTKKCPIVALTHGAKGCTIYQKSKATTVTAYPAQEIDPTGAGDVFATAFLISLHATGDPIEAARFANAAAACNIEKPGAEGVPTLEQIKLRMKTS